MPDAFPSPGPNLALAHPAGLLVLLSQGGQVLRWQPRGAAGPVTFLSAAAGYAPGRPVRGGIPVCWPWFGPHPANAAEVAHGFARNLPWAVGNPESVAGGVRVRASLTDSAQTRSRWPYPFHLSLVVTMDEALDVSLVTTNTGTQAFRYSEALHTYLAVSDLDAVRLDGLDGVGYIDTPAGGVRRRQCGPVVFGDEVDRIYQGPPAVLDLKDSGAARRIRVTSRGSASTIVWNPGAARAAALADLGPAGSGAGGWRRFVCVETGNVREHSRDLAPGESHELGVTLTLHRHGTGADLALVRTAAR